VQNLQSTGNTSAVAGSQSATAGAAVAGNALPLTVSKLQGTAHFNSSGHDTFALSGVLPGLPSPFDPAKKLITLDVGGAVVSLTLDEKGHAKGKQGSIALKLKRQKGSELFLGGNAAFVGTFKNGTWSKIWDLDPATSAKGQPMSLTIVINLAGQDYAVPVHASYTGKANASGKFKK
jgi:hypothetical protein